MDALSSLFSSDQGLWLLAALLLITFIGGLILVPWLIIRLPADYFQQASKQSWLTSSKHPVIRIFLLLTKNVLGGVLVLTGIAMLVLPGQGLLTILIGILLLDFPGKFTFERWLVRRKPILKSVNWLRHKRKQAPFRF